MTTRARSSSLIAGLALATTVSAQVEPVVRHLPPAAGGRVPLHTVVPYYPEKARRARIEGEVEVCFEVDREGRTHRVAVRRSTNRVFEKPAREAARESSYRPLPPGESLSGIKTCRTFRFTLEPVEADGPPDRAAASRGPGASPPPGGTRN